MEHDHAIFTIGQYGGIAYLIGVIVGVWALWQYWRGRENG